MYDLQLSPTFEERDELHEMTAPVLQPAENLCEKCSETFVDWVYLEGHMIKNHID